MATVTSDELNQIVRDLLSRYPPSSTKPERFLGAQFDAGLAWVHFPRGCGGLAIDQRMQSEVTRLLVEAGAPNPRDHQLVGVSMVAPVLAAHGTQEQRRRYLRPLFTGDEVWCQLFSEPGAGSDLAALATLAIRDGEEWIVNGQKVWTSFAHIASFGLLVARTNPDAPKHKGLTCFVADMRADGVEIRPLRQMTGDVEFNEVFMSDVRIADRHQLGNVGDGWAVVLTTLMNERTAIGGATGPQDAQVLAELLRVWEATGKTSPVLRDRIVRLWIDAECLRLTTLRTLEESQKGVPGPASSVRKLAVGRFHQQASELSLDLLGPAGTLHSSYGLESSERSPSATAEPSEVFLRSRALTIAGGTTEIMRNIVAERVLGLPGDGKGDRDLPWRRIPRN